MRSLPALLALALSSSCLLFLEPIDLEGHACESDTDCLTGYRCEDAVCVSEAAVGEDAGTSEDAGFDAGAPVDAGFDAGFDAGVADAGFDAGVADAGFDAGATDAGFDAGVADAGFDAGLDAGVADAGLDAGFDAGPVDGGCNTSSDAGLPYCPAVVYEAKDGTLNNGTAVQLRDMVVTAVFADGFWVQLATTSDDYAATGNSGIFVFSQAEPNPPARGDTLLINGVITEFFFTKQLVGATWTVVAQGADVITPVALNATALLNQLSVGSEAPLEGALVTVSDVDVTNPDAPPVSMAGDEGPNRNEFEVDSALHVDDLLHLISPYPTDGETFASLTGVLAWRNGLLKLLPRDDADVVRSAPPADVVINEVDYDNPATDDAEFIELFVKEASDVDMTGWKILLVDGTNATVYDTIDLDALGTLTPGSYALIHMSAVPTNGAPAIEQPSSFLHNATEAVVLVSPTSFVDHVTYEGTIVDADLGAWGTVALPGSTATVDPSDQGSLARSPNGVDTDAHQDWTLAGSPTPGGANN
jgi:hypothetical protein